MDYTAFISNGYVSQSPLADQEYTMNWYEEQVEASGGTTKAALYPTPGVSLLVDSGAGAGRGHFYQNGREFAVISDVLYEISLTGVLTNRGTVATDANPATISGNGDAGGQLFITSGGNGYVYDLTGNTLSAVAALAGIATMGDYLDGYFLCLDTTTSTVFISDLLDGTTWDPTQYIQRSIAPDDWVSMKVSNRYIYLWGSETGEVWFDAGAFPIPFEPHPSGLMQFGCGAPFSPEVVGDGVNWLSSTQNGSGAVLRATGFNPVVISTYATHYAFSQYTNLSDAIGDSYEDLGHSFYVLTFRQDNATWVWDATSNTNAWHNRGTWDPDMYHFDAWRPMFHAFAFGEHRILDLEGPGVYRMGSTYYADVDDLAIRRVRRAPCLTDENRLIFFSQFELDLEPGLALSSGQGSNPEVMLRISNDGGKTWGNEITQTAGTIGQYGKRVIWNRCGAGRRRVFEVSVSDPVPWRLLRAFIKVQQASKAA